MSCYEDHKNISWYEEVQVIINITRTTNYGEEIQIAMKIIVKNMNCCGKWPNIKLKKLSSDIIGTQID